MKGKKIRILVDSHIFDQSFQGTATYIHGLYTELVKFEEFEVSLCAHDVENLQVLFPDTRFKFVKLQGHSRIKRLFVEYPKIIKEGGYDYAHFQYIVPFVKNCKFINTVHDLLFLDFKQHFPWSYRISRKILFLLSAKRSEVILTVSEYSKLDIHNRFSIALNRIHVTPNAVSESESSKIDIAEKYGINKYILFVSRYEPRKNHIGLLKAYLQLELYEQGYKLVLIGSKKESIEIDAYKDVHALIEEAIKPNIFFLEGIGWSDLHAFYQQAECFVYPSLAEGFGIPPIEAAVNNCKVVCSNQTAMSEFTFFKYLFNPNTPGELAATLSIALNDCNYPFAEIKQAVDAKFNWTSIAGKFSDILIDDLKFNTK
ncbi:glycosyltransferase family 4 protein [Pedobacter sp. JCM 36344]|uniref:glycosyltransferase family 4 protein n=1 Tax=Pedobacter sp. JCM 36344 TaxID=3374280 RepID=UPI00397DA121